MGPLPFKIRKLGVKFACVPDDAVFKDGKGVLIIILILGKLFPEHVKELLPADSMVTPDESRPFFPGIVEQQAVFFIAPDGDLHAGIVFIEILFFFVLSKGTGVGYPFLQRPFRTQGEHAVNFMKKRQKFV